MMRNIRCDAPFHAVHANKHMNNSITCVWREGPYNHLLFIGGAALALGIVLGIVSRRTDAERPFLRFTIVTIAVATIASGIWAIFTGWYAYG